ncbi:MAG TPA: hypothetical protein VMR75_02815 [Candidatus Saccharimonadales bacterium]|nr:hypothetical protein [Candidatus Saccharimonadales bacterium]
MSVTLKALLVIGGVDSAMMLFVMLVVSYGLSKEPIRNRIKDQRQCREIMHEAGEYLDGEAESFLGRTECGDYAVETIRLLAAIRLATVRRIRPLSGDRILSRVEKLLGKRVEVEVSLMIGTLSYCVDHQLLRPVRKPGMGRQFKYSPAATEAKRYLQTDLSLEELKAL